MEEATVLILLSFVMFIGSYISGNIPIVLHISEEKLQYVSAMGAGLLVGTALAVIIPEGIHALQADQANRKSSVLAGTAQVQPGSSADIHALVGVSLVLGFVFMVLVDQCSSSVGRDVENGSTKSSSRNFTATLGLVVHAAADGVALGAAATTAHADVEMIVFVAIMLHKAPAAFGLVTFLLKEGLLKSTVKKHLLIFSASAPLLALLTFFCLGQESKEKLSSVNATGIAMLFSAGTFLYVATVHVLSEITSSHSHSASRPGTNAESVDRKRSLTPCELLCLVCGTLLPLLLAVGHHH
ncbi:zinc transporter ZIP9 [Bacillus rossius redtenbacheri]|uniref:zinc transporter ZIP9 n=1 Tax=Bacillus rossius redtenbacheri TaxID=93214 RepID=UPI002FDC881A